MTSTITQCVNDISAALRTLSKLFDNPSALTFHDIREDMERLEEQFKKKATIDAAFAFIAEREEAGRIVGANYPNAYLQQCLDLSKGEAYNRLERGRLLFGPPPGPAAHPESEESTEGLFSRTHEVERQQATARKTSSQVSAEKQNIIRRELDKLLKAGVDERTRIYSTAMAESLRRNPEDLRQFVRRAVADVNRKHAPHSNPNAGYENRGLSFGRRKADGTVDIHITAASGAAALIKAHTDKGLAPNSNLPAAMHDEVDSRTPQQRRFDQFFAIFQQHEQTQQKVHGGAASVIIALTLDDLADGDASMLYGTNTGIEVDCFDLVRLGMDGTTDFLLQVDGVTSVPLWMGRTTRLASVEQRIAMFAIQGVCSWLGCTTPMTECEAHHILAWIKGGHTDTENLTGLCREHHRCNNDNRDGSFNKGYMDFDPQTGKAGYRKHPSDPMKFNHSVPAKHSAVSRIYAAKGRCNCARTGERDPALYPPGLSPPVTAPLPQSA
ncbi:HNH endonuclease signature motif containing protein [Corynebacterium sp. NML130628]|uniref:HNH endonuclease signature motif containing protein n=1 Tax=Corynebacterium sp. NML130628 TaxID=1906333 RepID=UPI0009F8F4E9|nr:HNH endonuclease signature motif containing protein [Corynebacterium sp. NML130628]